MSNHAPFSKDQYTPLPMTWCVLIALAPLYIFSVFFFGLRPLILLLASVLAAAFCEWLACILLKKKVSLQDGTSIVTGAIIACIMSPLSPIWLPMIASAFAICVVKIPFGGRGRNIFNPAAAGIAFVTQCFSNVLFMYPDNDVDVSLGLFTFDANTTPSIASSLFTGGTVTYPWYDVFLGEVPGSIGTTAILLLIACAYFLYSKKCLSIATTGSFLLTCACIAFLFPRITDGRGLSVFYELCSGYLVFGAIFLLNDPVTSPSHTLGRIFYGVITAVLVMLLRHVGRFEEGMCFAIMLSNILVPYLDRGCWLMIHRSKVKKEESV